MNYIKLRKRYFMFKIANTIDVVYLFITGTVNIT